MAKTKERPILFNAEMVRAILDGRKTQTRRVIRVQPSGDKVIYDPAIGFRFHGGPNIKQSPYGKVGDELYVRETWSRNGSCIVYRSTWKGNDKKWHPSIHMPKWASRIKLRVTDVRVERLQSISEEDAISEGIWKYGDEDSYKMYTATTAFGTTNPIRSFKSLWESINKKRGLGWDKNPWVWVIEFEVIND
jgi:hypothetical protein